LQALGVGIIIAIIYQIGDPCSSRPCQDETGSECQKINGFQFECKSFTCSGQFCCDSQLCCENGQCNETNTTNFENCQCICDQNYAGKRINQPINVRKISF